MSNSRRLECVVLAAVAASVTLACRLWLHNAVISGWEWDSLAGRPAVQRCYRDGSRQAYLLQLAGHNNNTAAGSPRYIGSLGSYPYRISYQPNNNNCSFVNNDTGVIGWWKGINDKLKLLINSSLKSFCIFSSWNELRVGRYLRRTLLCSLIWRKEQEQLLADRCT